MAEDKTKEILEYLGIPAWDKAGYTGKGIKIISQERVSSASEFPYVIALDGYGKDDGRHGSNVMAQMKVIAPDATYYTCSEDAPSTSDWKPGFIGAILENEIDLFTTSKLSSVYKTSSTREKHMQECIDKGTTFFCAAGNGGGGQSLDIYEEAKSDKFLTIGACEFNDGMAGKAFYSCQGEELDYMMIANFKGENGTSYATNRFCALCARVQQLFKEKAGRTLYRDELIDFINDNVTDLRAKGWDEGTGWGIFRLPDPATIDVNKYLTHVEKQTMTMTIDSKEVDVDGRKVTFDTAPFIKEDRTFVPIKLIEELGLKVEWLETTRQVKITR